jgi:hypothetical protein
VHRTRRRSPRWRSGRVSAPCEHGRFRFSQLALLAVPPVAHPDHPVRHGVDVSAEVVDEGDGVAHPPRDGVVPAQPSQHDADQADGEGKSAVLAMRCFPWSPPDRSDELKRPDSTTQCHAERPAIGGTDLVTFDRYGWGLDLDLALRARPAGSRECTSRDGLCQPLWTRERHYAIRQFAVLVGHGLPRR